MRSLLVLTLLGTSASAAPPLVKLTAETGFIDDAYALRSDGAALADIVTDGATTATLRSTAVGGKSTTVSSVSPTAAGLFFVGPQKLLVVARDAKTQKVTGQLYGPTAGTKIGPADEITVGKVDGKTYVFSYSAKPGKTVEHVVTVYSPETLSVVTRRDFKENSEGRFSFAGGLLKPLWWQDGFGTLATMKAGEYDKAHDIREPDQFALLDVVTGKLHDVQPVTDVLGFAHITGDHKDHREAAFAHLSDDHTKLMMVDGTTEQEIKLDKPLEMYQLETLHTQELDADHLAISMVTDPVNPEALKRQKADPDVFQLYLVDRKSHVAKSIFQLPAEGRPISWRAQAKRIAILHKSKGFDRGGVLLELFDLP